MAYEQNRQPAPTGNGDRRYICVAVSGHRDLRQEDIPRLNAEVRAAFDAIEKRFPDTEIQVISPLARGADQLVAEVARNRKYTLQAYLPYREPSVAAWLQKTERAYEERRSQLEAEAKGGAPTPKLHRALKALDLDVEEFRGQQDLLSVAQSSVLPVSGSKNPDFETNAERLVTDSAVLLALWDGIDNGKDGGTADVVAKARRAEMSPASQRLPRGKRLDQRLILHIPTPRKSNPYTVQPSFRLRVIEPEPRSADQSAMLWNRALKVVTNAQFLFTALLLSTLFSGYYGLYEYCGLSEVQSCTAPASWGDHLNLFWTAVSLPLLQVQMHLDHSVEGYPVWLLVGEVLGATTFTATIVAAFLALFANSIGAWLKVKRRSLRSNHTVVIGLGWTGLEIVQDLAAEGHRPVVIDRDPDPARVAAAESVGALVLTGDATQASTLSKARLAAASDVYVVGGAAAPDQEWAEPADEINARILFQMAALAKDERTRDRTWSVHIANTGARTLAHRTVQLSPKTTLRTFAIWETCARRLLRENPLDRYPHAANKGINTIVFGYNPLTRALLHEAMQLGHYPHVPADRIRYTVFAKHSDQASTDWIQRYPACGRADGHYEARDSGALRSAVLPTLGKRLEFKDLPLSDRGALDDGFDFDARTGEAANVYICLDAGLDSARFAASILPRLQALKDSRKWDVRVYLYYDFPERSESVHVTRGLNGSAPNVYVASFDTAGSTANAERRNLVSAIVDADREELAKQVHTLYKVSEAYGKKGDKAGHHSLPLESKPIPDWLEKKRADLLRLTANLGNESEERPLEFLVERNIELARELRQVWRHQEFVRTLAEHYWRDDDIGEADRESSRRAAEHIFVKARSLKLVTTGEETFDLDSEPDWIGIAASWDEHAESLGKSEHARWCADHFLMGFTPLRPEDYEKWSNGGKQLLRDQKSHLHLRSFGALSDWDQSKDVNQVLMAPWLLAASGQRLALYQAPEPRRAVTPESGPHPTENASRDD